MRPMTTRWLPILTVAMAWLPEAASACPTCYASTSEKVLSSYVWSAAFMTLLPFSIIAIGAAIAWYLHRSASTVTDETIDATIHH